MGIERGRTVSDSNDRLSLKNRITFCELFWRLWKMSVVVCLNAVAHNAVRDAVVSAVTSLDVDGGDVFDAKYSDSLLYSYYVLNN